MKNRTTQKEVKNSFNKVICVGYCNLQYILSAETPAAYTARREGWAADVYDFGSVAIVTGYAPFGNVKPDYATQKRYDDKAREICNTVFYWDERKTALRALIDQFIEEVTI